ncbi:MAG: AAA family ATPase [Myxococcota bacterium]
MDRRLEAAHPGAEAGAGAPTVTRVVATVMFADILGFSAIAAERGSDAALAAVSGCLQLLDRVARRHGGAVDKYLGDSLLVLFGGRDSAPDSERNALLAALEMRDEARHYGLSVPGGEHMEVAVGVNTGFVTLGEVGDSLMREFAIMGDAVNVAARLKSKAGAGRIYAGVETCAAGGQGLVLESVEPLALKGKSSRVPAFAVQGIEAEAATALRAPANAAGRVFGREAECARIAERLRALRSGEGGSIWIHGPPGIGKTALVAELDSGDAGLLHAVPVGEAEATRLRSFTRLGRFALGAPAPEGAGDDPERIREALESTARKRPLAIAFDDLHRTDPDSLELLAGLVRRLAEDPGLPLLLILLSREPPPSGLAVETLALGPLEASPAHQLLDSLPEGAGLDADLRRLVLGRAAGNPAAILLGPFLAEALAADARRQSETAERSSEAERRRATVLFADLSGFTAMSERLDPAVAYDIFTDCLGRLDAVARRFGGTVEKRLGDCVLALFGVPHAIEDAPRAAVNAAIEMRNAVVQFNEDRGIDPPLSIHTGIETGAGITADVSGPLIREFALMGDSVSTANRLTDAAGAWEIYVGGGTFGALRGVFEFEPRDDAEGAGPAYAMTSGEVQLHRARRDGGISSRFVGREPELAACRRAFQAAAAGRGGVLRVRGEAGLGKTRLVEELRDEHGDSILWLQGRSLSSGAALGHHAFSDLLFQWLRLSPDSSEDTVSSTLDRELRRLAGDEAPEIAASFRRVLGLSRDPTAGGEGQAQVLLKHFTRWLRLLGDERPVVLVFEDLHWADLSSVELLESLLRLADEQPVLFVLLYRPDYADTSGRIEAHVDAATQAPPVVALAPLDGDGSRELIRNLFRGAEVPLAIRRSLAERAAGNPFFLEEAIRSLLEQGALERVDGDLVATARIARAEIPGTIEEVIMARIDRLELRKREFLQVAAVMGVNFFLGVVESVLGVTDPRELTESLLEGEFLAHADALPGLDLAFKHPLIQEVIYRSMLEERRRKLHAAVATAAEEQLEGVFAGFHAMLAFHYARGDAPEAAEPHLFAAGEEAARSAASNEALQFFREASDLFLSLHGDAGDPEKRSTLEAHLAMALLNRGQLGESVEHFDRALSLLGAPAPGSTAGFVGRLALDLPVVLLQLYRPFGRAGSGRASDESERRIFDLMFRRAIAQSTSDPDRFLFDSLAMLRRLGRFDPSTVPESAALYAGAIGIFSYGAGMFGVGRRLLERADGLAAAGAVEERELYYRLLRFLHYFWSGDWSEEHRIPEPIVERGLAEGRLWEVSTYLDIDTDRSIRRGQFDRAEERLAKLTEVADLHQHDLAWSAVRAHRTFLPLERRQLDVAARAGESYYEEYGDVPINLYALGERAKIEILKGDLDAGEKLLEGCRRLRKKAGRVSAMHAITSARSQLLYDVTRLEGARAAGDGAAAARARRAATRAARAALRTCESIASRRTEVHRLAGRLDWLIDRRERAAARWRRARSIAEEMGARPEAARLLAEVGLRTAEHPKAPRVFEDLDAEGCVDEARRMFEAMQLERDRADLEAGRVP